MKKLTEKADEIWDKIIIPLAILAVAGHFYLESRQNSEIEAEKNKENVCSQMEHYSGEHFRYKNYDVMKGFDKNGKKYLKLRDGFYTRLERPTTLFWEGDSISFSLGRDMGRGAHYEDSNHYFTTLNKDSLENIFEKLGSIEKDKHNK